jgi:hypothetical protein
MAYFRNCLFRCATLILIASLLTGVGFASQSGKKTSRATTSTSKSGETASEIAQARAKGLVWVNTKSRIYHTGGRYYGTTKHGRFTTLADARKAGYRAAKR